MTLPPLTPHNSSFSHTSQLLLLPQTPHSCLAFSFSHTLQLPSMLLVLVFTLLGYSTKNTKHASHEK